MKPAARQRMNGFTLLEVLASLVLLALLLIGVYSGLRTATHSVHSGTAAVERIDQIRSAQQFLQRELAQSLAQPISHNDHGEPIYFVGSAREMRYVAPLPGYLGKLGPQLQRLQLIDDGHGESRLELSLALLPPDGQPPRPLGDPQVLLDHIRAGSFSYRGIDAQGHAVPWAAAWADGRLLPLLVRIALQPQGSYDWPLLEVPLRVNPMSSGMQTGLQSLGNNPGRSGR
jgi:general secretion pathway protein J